MGIGGISIWQLLVVLAIVIMIFGTKKIRNLGWDLGSAFQGIRHGIKQSLETFEAVEDDIKDTIDEVKTLKKKAKKIGASAS